MLHVLLYGALAIVLGGLLFAVAARFLPAGEQIAPPVRDEPPWELPPDRAMRPDEVDAVRLPVALRGYRFAETDILLDRLADELRVRDAEIARLRGEAPAAEPEQVVDQHEAARAAAANPDERLEEELAVAEAIDEAPAPDRRHARPDAASDEPADEPGQDAADEPAEDELVSDRPRRRRLWHK